MTALLDLSGVVDHLRIDGHLPECRRSNRPLEDCDWCLWAVDVPQVRTLLDVLHDARTLRNVGAARPGSAEWPMRDTVPWVLASVELRQHRAEARVGEVVVASVRHVVEQLAREADDHLDRLDRLVAAAVAPDGPIERRCLRTAGALAATRLGRPECAPVLAGAPENVRRAIAEVTALLSPDSQAGSLIPVVDAAHWRGLPELRTQPVWRLRPPAGCGMRHPGPQHDRTTRRDSLEAIVVESLADRVSDSLLAVAGDLARLGTPVDLIRRREAPRRSARSLTNLHRMALVDWHLSLVDCGRADCWPTRHEEGRRFTAVPWVVAAAVDVMCGVAVSTVHAHDPSRPDLLGPGPSGPG
ncbi:MAG: hypothetical protein FJW94_00985 [Actinobacteria bacterium]|nr:hypothetical protein [Actinomycetota bacterium]